MATKYRLKAEFGGYLALTSVGFSRIIRKDDELELSAAELVRLNKYVEPIPKVKKVIKKKVEEERVIDTNVEDDK
jgi:hypothetical protein